MKRFLCAILLVCLTGCDLEIQIDLPGINQPIRPSINYPEYEPQVPRINIEKYLRQKNWIGYRGGGSCTHACLTMILRHQGRMDAADYWKRKYGDGETFDSLTAKLDAEGFRWVGTCRENDVAFLEWTVATRRGALVTCRGGAHAILLVHLDQDWAYLIDNNFPNREIKVPRQQFLSEWVNSNSWGITILGTPPPLEPCK